MSKYTYCIDYQVLTDVFIMIPLVLFIRIQKA